MIKNYSKFLVIFLITFMVFSCAKKKEEIPTGESSYIKAKKLLDEKNYAEAAKEFEKIDDDFPFSKWATQSQNMAVYAFYKNKDYADVVRAVDDFIRINPSNETIPYMYYMKALSYYDQIPDIERAQDNARLSSATFRELIARFPDSDHTIDARYKLEFVDEHIAGAKMAVGRYQVTQKHYVGALKNFHDVVQRYSYTDQAPEAYYRLIEIYHKIGLKNEAIKVRNQLEAAFPSNEWMALAQKIDF
ncbi:MAG: outer membrane protein assembly factor BamD [Rickettsiales bacterium]|nr:outer membrane protein assembly factor BamD [Rickettsiales bacterium]